MKYRIISGQYELGTEEQKMGYKMLFGADNIQYKFDLYFHWYNIVHELGHCVADVLQISMSKVQEEMFANEFSVAYWKYVGEEARVRELENILTEIVANLPSPVPKEISFVEYFEDIWGTELLNNVMLYGYFQLNSVLEAIKGNRDFSDVLKTVGIELDDNFIMEKYSDIINAVNSKNVLNNSVTNINKIINDPIQVKLELVNNPMIQCAQKCD